MTIEDNRNTVRRYSWYGLWTGLFLGVIVGVMVGGSRFREWDDPVMSSGVLMAACGSVGAIIGTLFFWLLSPGTRGGGSYGGGEGAGDGGDGD